MGQDVAICNPPYLPLLAGFERLGLHSVVAGTELLVHVLSNAPVLARRVFIQYSDLARAGTEGAAAAHDVELVSFRVTRAWSEIPEYFEQLKAIPGGLVRRSESQHPYWHKIRTCEVRKRSG